MLEFDIDDDIYVFVVIYVDIVVVVVVVVVVIDIIVGGGWRQRRDVVPGNYKGIRTRTAACLLNETF